MSVITQETLPFRPLTLYFWSRSHGENFNFTGGSQHPNKVAGEKMCKILNDRLDRADMLLRKLVRCPEVVFPHRFFGVFFDGYLTQIHVDLRQVYRFRFTSSSSIVSEVVMTREFA